MTKEYQSRWSVFAMSLPIFIEIGLQMLVPNMDQFMLSHYSQDAVAAVGNGNMILIHGLGPIPSLGVAGVCISTNTAKVLGLLLVMYLLRKKTPLRLSLRHLRPFPKKTLKNLLYLGIPSAGETFSYQLSQTTIMTFVNLFGIAVSRPGSI